MKKFLMITLLAALACTMSGCCSLRTPMKGKNRNNVYYFSFFGLSLESAVYGDGFVLGSSSK